MTFEFIRLELVDGAPRNVEELDRLFRSQSMAQQTRFKEDVRVDAKAEKYGGRISAYENAERDVSFGTQRRYAIASGTRTGAIHFISLFYAFLRCAAAEETDSALRKGQILEALATAGKLKSLAVAAEEMVLNAERSGLLTKLRQEAWGDTEQRRLHQQTVMAPLFEAYRRAVEA